jgi:hypothetical protein
MSRKVMAAILTLQDVVPLRSDKRFSVDATLIKAGVSLKSFQPKAACPPPGDYGTDIPRQRRLRTPLHSSPSPKPRLVKYPSGNFAAAMLRSTSKKSSVRMRPMLRSSHPDARLCKKFLRTGPVMCFMGPAIMESRHGLVVQGDLAPRRA